MEPQFKFQVFVPISEQTNILCKYHRCIGVYQSSFETKEIKCRVFKTSNFGQIDNWRMALGNSCKALFCYCMKEMFLEIEIIKTSTN